MQTLDSPTPQIGREIVLVKTRPPEVSDGNGNVVGGRSNTLSTLRTKDSETVRLPFSSIDK